jgi:hypothetical protein
MAITTNTFSVNAGYARSDVLNQFENALTWLGWHGDTQTGIITGMSSSSGGGVLSADIPTGVSRVYEDIRQTSTSGIGTGASFWVERTSGSIAYIVVNRPGIGYTNGEVVQISGDSIGGIANGATTLELTVLVAGNNNPIGYGSTTSFYDSDKGGSFPWGVLRHTIEPNKRYGDTYRSIQVTSNTGIRFGVGTGFHPWDVSSNTTLRNGQANRFVGQPLLDMPIINIFSSSNSLNTSTSFGSPLGDITFATNSGYQVDLNVFRSAIDPNFAVFSYKQPTLSSTHLTSNTFATFFFHNFTTNLWDLDELFLGGITYINPITGNTTQPYIDFRSQVGGNRISSRYSSREAGSGYIKTGFNSSFETSSPFVTTRFKSNTYLQSRDDYNTRIYYRSVTNSPIRSKGGNGREGNDSISPNTDFNGVIKGIPLSNAMIPCPYYIPDDFVLIDFDFSSPSANIQQGDTITISPSEVYTVISGSYNQTTRTRGILFCARTV